MEKIRGLKFFSETKGVKFIWERIRGLKIYSEKIKGLKIWAFLRKTLFLNFFSNFFLVDRLTYVDPVALNTLQCMQLHLHL